MAPPDVAPVAPRKSTNVAPPAAPAKVSASPAAPEGRIYAHAELPEDVRRQIPAVTIGGSMYSEHAANRMLIVNGQLLHEGDKLGPELTLERIKLKSAVLRFKSYRYEISY
jgi:general secretion pathway protein B